MISGKARAHRTSAQVVACSFKMVRVTGSGKFTKAVSKKLHVEDAEDKDEADSDKEEETVKEVVKDDEQENADGSDDEEGQMEVMLKKKGTLDGFRLEEDAANGSGEEEESDESDLEDSEDERELEDEVQRLKTEAAKRMAATKTAKPPPENETEEERMAREKSETAEALSLIHI